MRKICSQTRTQTLDPSLNRGSALLTVLSGLLLYRRTCTTLPQSGTCTITEEEEEEDIVDLWLLWLVVYPCLALTLLFTMGVYGGNSSPVHQIQMKCHLSVLLIPWNKCAEFEFDWTRSRNNIAETSFSRKTGSWNAQYFRFGLCFHRHRLTLWFNLLFLKLTGDYNACRNPLTLTCVMCCPWNSNFCFVLLCVFLERKLVAITLAAHKTWQYWLLVVCGPSAMRGPSRIRYYGLKNTTSD